MGLVKSSTVLLVNLVVRTKYQQYIGADAFIVTRAYEKIKAQLYFYITHYGILRAGVQVSMCCSLTLHK